VEKVLGKLSHQRQARLNTEDKQIAKKMVCQIGYELSRGEL
jgi:hypothetical protein